MKTAIGKAACPHCNKEVTLEIKGWIADE